MHRNLTRFILWGSRLVCLAIILWWPHLWYDPIYTPRQARLAGQALHLPSGATPHTQAEQAMAIFWEWQHRSLVTARWGADSFKGVRDPFGRGQAIFALLMVWIGSSSVLFLLGRKKAPALPTSESSGVRALFVTPIWQLLTSFLRSTAPSQS